MHADFSFNVFDIFAFVTLTDYNLNIASVISLKAEWCQVFVTFVFMWSCSPSHPSSVSSLLSPMLLQDPLPNGVAQHLHQQAEEEREAGRPKRTRPSDRQETRWHGD